MKYLHCIVSAVWMPFLMAVPAGFPVCAETPLFPFVISFDAPDNAANISYKLDAPAGKDGFVRVENGHFVTEKGRIRFWGTNTSGETAFLDKESADQVADRLARFGINCVRLHHLDMRDIWGGADAKTFMEFDKAQLDKLDYYVAALKKRGIYVNVNLHVSRTLDERDGFPKNENRISYDKGVDNYYRPFIDANKKYARDLLTHVNPYTGIAYKDEPAVAMIEINNENSILSTWSWRGLERTQEIFRDAFRKEWNNWLKKKYKDDNGLAKAWDYRKSPLGDKLGEEVLPNTDFSNGYLPKGTPWYWDTGGGADAPVTNVDGVLRMDVRKKGEVNWQPQLLGNKFAVKKDEVYTLRIKAKASQNTRLNISVRKNHDNLDAIGIGYNMQANLTTEWQTLSIPFFANVDETDCRLAIGGFTEGFVYEFDEISLRPGGNVDIGKHQTIASGMIPVIWARWGSEKLPAKAAEDFYDFLFDLEANYWNDMYRFLKDEIKVKQPISGTQIGYGATSAQANLDYCDIHEYWNHPVFPGKSWDASNWYVRDRALVNSLDKEIFPRLATSRVHGKPLTVSEYCHPHPNRYAAEGLPLIAVFGAFQDWDGIFSFTYSYRKEPQRKMVTNYFDLSGSSVHIAHSIACYLLFCENIENNVAAKTVVGPFPAEKERELFKKNRNQDLFRFAGIEMDPRLSLLYPTALDMSGKTTKKPDVPEIPEDQKRFLVKNGETGGAVLYDMTIPDRGFVSARNSSAALFTGFVEEGKQYPFLYGNIEFGKTNLGWATVTLAKLGGGSKAETPNAEKILLAATGEMLNTFMKIESLGEDKITVNWRWGKEPVRCEGIPAVIELKNLPYKTLRCWPLDSSGNRKEEIKVLKSGKGFNLELKPEYKTIWYEMEGI